MLICVHVYKPPFRFSQTPGHKNKAGLKPASAGRGRWMPATAGSGSPVVQAVLRRGWRGCPVTMVDSEGRREQVQHWSTAATAWATSGTLGRAPPRPGDGGEGKAVSGRLCRGRGHRRRLLVADFDSDEAGSGRGRRWNGWIRSGSCGYHRRRTRASKSGCPCYFPTSRKIGDGRICGHRRLQEGCPVVDDGAMRGGCWVCFILLSKEEIVLDRCEGSVLLNDNRRKKITFLHDLESVAKLQSVGRAGLMNLAEITSSTSMPPLVCNDVSKSKSKSNGIYLAHEHGAGELGCPETSTCKEKEEFIDSLRFLVDHSKQHFNPKYRQRVCTRAFQAASSIICKHELPLKLILHFVSSLPRELSDVGGGSFSSPSRMRMLGNLVAWRSEFERWAGVLLTLKNGEKHLEPLFKYERRATPYLKPYPGEVQKFYEFMNLQQTLPYTKVALFLQKIPDACTL
ncbi:hypothetical protein AKJ16_DCAP25675 [Drosera capensis]